MNKARKFIFTKQLFLQNNNSLASDNSIDTHLSEIFKNVVTAHSTFISLIFTQPFPQSFTRPQTFTQFNLFIQQPQQPPRSLQSLTRFPLSP